MAAIGDATLEEEESRRALATVAFDATMDEMEQAAEADLTPARRERYQRLKAFKRAQLLRISAVNGARQRFKRLNDEDRVRRAWRETARVAATTKDRVRDARTSLGLISACAMSLYALDDAYPTRLDAIVRSNKGRSAKEADLVNEGMLFFEYGRKCKFPKVPLLLSAP